MALLTIPIFDTIENNRHDLTRQTLNSLAQTVDWGKHRLVVVNNGSEPRTRLLLDGLCVNSDADTVQVIHNAENRGVAYACNQALLLRHPGEVVIKMDNDVVIQRGGWVEDLCECIEREPRIGILGLKRKDLPNWPLLPVSDGNRSQIVPLPHRSGERFLAVEKVPFRLGFSFNAIVGTVIALSPKMLDTIGYFWHLSKGWGHEDTLLHARAEASGFIAAYWPWIEIIHTDPMAQDDYLKWKLKSGSEHASETMRIIGDILRGKQSYYFGFFEPEVSHTIPHPAQP